MSDLKANVGYYVAVHVGAGYHGKNKEREYKAAMKNACRAAAEQLRSGGSASNAVESAIRVLEDSPATNAGIGSNLNRLGLVECDASIMSSQPDGFGAIGASTAAHAVLRNYCKGPDPSTGLVPPMFLVGEGADSWATGNGVATDRCSRHKITEEALSKYSRYMDRISTSGESSKVAGSSEDVDLQMDTVGAVCIDRWGEVSAGVSSGGIALKLPGRVGEAAMFGCGCWAEKTVSKVDPRETLSTGCSVTGTGEQIMRTLLARDCAQRDGDIFSVLSECFENFNSTRSLAVFKQRSAGLILLRKVCDGSDGAELGVAHTTHSMGYGYMSEAMSQPVAKISRKSEASDTTVSAIRL
ncbi:taspase, threonine aspartase, 1 [Coemansia pectinata]|uniref:Taspase, threonine aspartase, 1 n=1 Tax=Coemansia pectinata TaxID=1052879 RepID=A0A9W8H0E3_9FUNG|nr:taspase, threonine aspartase, 1 [Coemansia pectinata]